jgi:hypothetical protein
MARFYIKAITSRLSTRRGEGIAGAQFVWVAG